MRPEKRKKKTIRPRATGKFSVLAVWWFGGWQQHANRRCAGCTKKVKRVKKQISFGDSIKWKAHKILQGWIGGKKERDRHGGRITTARHTALYCAFERNFPIPRYRCRCEAGWHRNDDGLWKVAICCDFLQGFPLLWFDLPPVPVLVLGRGWHYHHRLLYIYARCKSELEPLVCMLCGCLCIGNV